MSNLYAYDGTTWRDIAEPWAYDGATWREIVEAWSYDGATWRKVFESGPGCATASCNSIFADWHDQGGLGCGACASGRCILCMKLDWTDCTDVCHNVDGMLSTNGGSYLLSLECANKACGNNTACGCGLSGSWDFRCNMLRRCALDTNSYQARAVIQLDAGGDDCTITEGSSHTGACEIA